MSLTKTAVKSIARGLRKPLIHVDAGVQMRVDDANLPSGICGRIIVTALTFNVTDTYGTQFAPGCADRSIAMKVAAGKLPLLRDHDNAIEAHVGVVRKMTTIGDAYVAECDILDNPWGRAYLEYAKSCIAAGANTGASIRFVPRAWENVKVGDRTIERFTEIELKELTVVPLSSVPNTDLLAARTEGAEGDDAGASGDTTVDTERDDATLLAEAARVALDAMTPEARQELFKQYAKDTDQTGTDTARAEAATPPIAPVQQATEDERLRAVRELTQ